MLKNKRILLTILVALVLLLVPSIVNAADGEVNITSIEVTAPQSGVYSAGQEITLRVTFDKAVYGTMPELEIYFGSVDSAKEIAGPIVTTAANYVEYTYTITADDNGMLRLNGRGINYELKDENNNPLNLVNNIYDLSGNKLYAENSIVRANLSNAKFEWVSTFGHNTYLDLKLTNVATIEGNRYYVHLSHNPNEQISALSYENQDIWESLDENKITFVEDTVEENGDIYVWVCEVDGTYRVPKLLINGQKIERKAQLPLGNRIKAYFFDDKTSTFCYETITEANKRKINVKIGMITDKSILRAIKDGEANALQGLLDYSKSAEAFYTGKVPVGESDAITNSLHLIDEEYYYVYMQLDDENGKYYPVEDISLFQALILDDGRVNLFDCFDDDYVWNLDEEGANNPTPAPTPTPEPEKKPAKTEDNTKAPGSLPYTGGTFVIIVSVLAIIALGIYAYRRNNDLKGI